MAKKSKGIGDERVLTFLKEVLSAFADILYSFKDNRPNVTNVELTKYLNSNEQIQAQLEKKLDNNICVKVKKASCNENYISGNIAIHSFYNENRDTKTFLRNIFDNLDELYNALSIEQV